MIDNIKNLYAQLNNKSSFIALCAHDLNKSANTLANHWFCRFWSIPDRYQERVVHLLQQTILNQSQP